MFGYYLRLAAKSFMRNPGLTMLMVLAIGLGIGVCVTIVTVYHGVSGNPIWWKNDRLYAVTMDSWDPIEPHNKQRPDLPPPQLTYRDATYLLQSTIPERKVVMNTVQGVLTGGTKRVTPIYSLTRATTRDFFSMFDVPFKYGSGWDAAADEGPEPVIVLSDQRNNELFGGENSVGRTIRWNDREFRIVGVLDEWNPAPKFYDLNHGAFLEPEDAYIPWRFVSTLELRTEGNLNCWKPEERSTFQEFLASECVWLQMWVELPTKEARERMQSLLDSYWAEQRKLGRFQRPMNNRLSNVSQWLKEQEVVRSDNRVLLGLAFAFLAVCLVNTVGMLLAKFLSNASLTGVRRALGASRRHIFWQHLTEVGLVSVAGALLGLVLGSLGLAAIRVLYADPRRPNAGLQAIAHVDEFSVATAVALAIVATVAAGLYPAWRIGRVPPAVYLKSQ